MPKEMLNTSSNFDIVLNETRWCLLLFQQMMNHTIHHHLSPLCFVSPILGSPILVVLSISDGVIKMNSLSNEADNLANKSLNSFEQHRTKTPRTKQTIVIDCHVCFHQCVIVLFATEDRAVASVIYCYVIIVIPLLLLLEPW